MLGIKYAILEIALHLKPTLTSPVGYVILSNSITVGLRKLRIAANMLLLR
jgi:hypothetical protein